MGRFAPAALVAALLVATAAAFAYTERLKLTPTPIKGTNVDKLFSPACECATDTSRIAFRLRRPDRVTVAILNRDGAVVRTVVSGRRQRAGLVVAYWDGRDDSGQIVPDGAYKPRVKLALNRRTIVLPNPIRVDTTPPRVEVAEVKPRVFSPDGDGRSDRVTVSYRVDEPAQVSLYVDGVRRVVKRGSRQKGAIDWSGKVSGSALDTGAHDISLVARDLAGNLGARAAPTRVVLRYVTLGRKRIVVVAGRRFALRVSADATRVEWHLGRRGGTVVPGTIHIRAPQQPGRYTLTVREHGHAVRAAVIVRAVA